MPTPCARRRGDDLEQPLHFALGQRGGRLVHDQDRARRRRAPSRSRRAAARAWSASRPAARDRWRRRRGRAARARRRRRSAQSTRRHGAGPSNASAMFSATVRCGKERRLLIDRRDAQRTATSRDPCARTTRPADGERAGIGRLGAGHDLDQRRLAGAVLADERMHFARRAGRTTRRSARVRRRMTSKSRWRSANVTHVIHMYLQVSTQRRRVAEKIGTRG